MTAANMTLAERYTQMANMHHDLLVVMQATLIEARHGGGEKSALEWIENTLDGPGLLPDENAPWGKEAQAFFDANRSDPLPPCFCGRPSNIGWMSQGFCSKAHYEEKQARLAQLDAGAAS